MVIGGNLPQMDSGLVSVIIATITFIGWLSRLESKGATNERDIAKLEKRIEIAEAKHDTLDTRVMEKLSAIENILGNIQGKLEVRQQNE